MPEQFNAIEVEGLEKTFRIPEHRVNTLKERVLHPLRPTRYDLLHILEAMSFEVRAGEFFGIVGRNGSGKSTLLKCLAGVYRADAGEIRIAGRVAPFIELGVGFNPELTAHENVLINAVMMGLSPREARSRFDAIIDFAELKDFTDLKVKNYSSGMQVRLAFSTMVQSSADVMLIDEVLAVGDAAFQAKCFDVFDDLRASGRTIVLVTHDMGLVERFCDRAMLIHEHRLERIGSPDKVAQRYLDINYEETPENDGSHTPGAMGEQILPETWVSGPDGQPMQEVPFGGTMDIVCRVEPVQTIAWPEIRVWIENAQGVEVFAASNNESPEMLGPIAANESRAVRVSLENRMVTGTYHVGAMITENTPNRRVVGVRNRATQFEVVGGDHVGGMVEIPHSIEFMPSTRTPA